MRHLFSSRSRIFSASQVSTSKTGQTLVPCISTYLLSLLDKRLDKFPVTACSRNPGQIMERIVSPSVAHTRWSAPSSRIDQPYYWSLPILPDELWIHNRTGHCLCRRRWILQHISGCWLCDLWQRQPSDLNLGCRCGSRIRDERDRITLHTSYGIRFDFLSCVSFNG